MKKSYKILAALVLVVITFSAYSCNRGCGCPKFDMEQSVVD